MPTSNRGFASMDEKKQHDIASKGGLASEGHLHSDTTRAAEAGKKGAAAQPIEAKAKGGKAGESGKR